MNGLKTIMSALVAIAAVASGQLGWAIPLLEIEGLGNDLLAIAASASAIWGRIVATKIIGGGELQ